jgi:hypothetical protein
VTLSVGQAWPYNITRTSGSDTTFDVNLYWATSPGGTKYPFSCLAPTPTPTPDPTPASTPTSTPPPPAFESWSVRTENNVVPINICGELEITVYSASGTLFTSGTALYSDSALTTSLFISGPNNPYISEIASAFIWNYNNGLGEIGSNTGSSC